MGYYSGNNNYGINSGYGGVGTGWTGYGGLGTGWAGHGNGLGNSNWW